MAIPVAVRAVVDQSSGCGNLHHPGLPVLFDSGAVRRAIGEQPRRARSQRRPVAVLSVVVIYTVLGVLTYEGATAPWSPKMTACER